ncbi:unnamed protein product [Closterium sp. NIES-64]|nr:unnamed protein product [Closterium sp. NIES-64]
MFDIPYSALPSPPLLSTSSALSSLSFFSSPLYSPMWSPPFPLSSLSLSSPLLLPFLSPPSPFPLPSLSLSSPLPLPFLSPPSPFPLPFLSPSSPFPLPFLCPFLPPPSYLSLPLLRNVVARTPKVAVKVFVA